MIIENESSPNNTELEERLRQLESIARHLEPSPAERESVRQQVLAYADGFLNSIENIKAYNLTDENGAGLLNTPISEDGIGIEKALELIEKQVDFPGLNPASGGHLGYIPGGGIYYSALGDYLADVTNRYAGVFFGGPGAVRMENMLIRWVADLIGYPSESAGNLTSGGSIANLIAICTARDVKNITADKLTKSVIYLTRQIHHSIQKALRIAGLGECILRYIEIDERFKMRVDLLEKQISADKDAGLNPFLIIASAGTTDTGAIDPLERIAAAAKREDLWFHIDAAYGGFFILTDEGSRKLKGMELSDSLTIDAHKGMFLPYGSGMVLVRRREDLFASYYYEANYMQDTLSATEELSPADLSPELTKHFRGMRFWLPLQLHGVKPFRACLEEKLLLAEYFHQKIKNLGFESSVEPELSVVVYRYLPSQGDADLFNKKLVDAVQRDGRIFISSTMLNGKFTLRFACLSFRTHRRQVDLLLEVMKSEVQRLEESFTETTETLFSYGTLQRNDVQLKLFGRLLDGTRDILQNYKLAPFEIKDEAFLAKGEDKNQLTLIRSNNEADLIEGTVFAVSPAELIAADKYEPDNYRRVKVPLRSGTEAWIYTVFENG